MRKLFTKKEDAFIKQNYLNMTMSAIARKLKRSKFGVRHRLQILGISIPAEVLKERSKIGLYRKGAIPMNKGKKQSEYMSAEAIENSKSFRFKKGNIPHNSIGKKDGDIVVRHQNKKINNPKPYKYIRLALGKWYPLHQKIWQDENGKVPEGMCIWFKDGDTLNCTIDNLELITRAEIMSRNTISQYPEELKQTIILTNKIKRKIESHEKHL